MSQNLEIAKGMYAAFAKSDVAGVLGAMSPNIEWREADNFPYAGGNPYIGPNAILNGVFMRLVMEWDKFTVTPQNFHDAGNVVVVTGRYTSAYKETGNRVDAQFVHVLTFDDGKMTHFQGYADTLQFAQAMKA